MVSTSLNGCLKTEKLMMTCNCVLGLCAEQHTFHLAVSCLAMSAVMYKAYISSRVHIRSSSVIP